MVVALYLPQVHLIVYHSILYGIYDNVLLSQKRLYKNLKIRKIKMNPHISFSSVFDELAMGKAY